MNYYIIIPAHNEQVYLADTLNSVMVQTLPPQKIVVVNDNSTDDTEKIIDTFSEKIVNLQKLNILTSTEHIPGSKVVNAFNKGLAILPEIAQGNYDFVVKLDADIILPSHYFEQIANIFRKRPKAGIAGGFAYEEEADGQWKLNHPMNKDHVRGAFKSYTKDCFKAIGGLRTAMGWDTVDELLAQYHGFTIITEDSLKVKHLRPIGKAYNKKARLLQGEAMYTMRYGIWITLIASLKMAWKKGIVKVFFHNLTGYFKASKNEKPFIVSYEEGRFIRKFRWKKIVDSLF